MRLSTSMTARAARVLLCLGAIAGVTAATRAGAVVQIARPQTIADSLDYAERVLLPRAPAEAADAARAVLRALHEAPPPDSLLIADALDLLVRAKIESGTARDPEARQAVDLAAGIRGRHQNRRDRIAAPTMHLSARLSTEARDYARAKEVLDRELEYRKTEYGDSHPLTAESMNELAEFYWARAHAGGNPPNELKETANKALMVAAVLAVAAIVVTVVDMISGDDKDDAKKKQEEEDKKKKEDETPTYEAATTNEEETDDTDIVGDLIKSILFDEQDLQACRDLVLGEQLASKALVMRAAALDPDDPALAESHMTIAKLARDGGDLGNAMDQLDRARAIDRAAWGYGSLDALRADVEIGEILLEQMAYPSARRSFEEAIAAMSSASIGEPSLRVRAHLGLAAAFDAQGDPASARAAYERAAALARAPGATSWVEGIRADIGLARLLERAGDLRNAEKVLERALGEAKRRGGKHHPVCGDVEMELGYLHRARRDATAAIHHFSRAHRIREAAFGKLHPLVADSWIEIAACWEARGDSKKAEADYQYAVLILDRTVGPDHPRTAYARAQQARVRRLARSGTGASPDTSYYIGLRGQGAWRRYLTSTIQYLPEPEALEIAGRPSTGLEVALSYLHEGSGPVDVDLAWDEVIRSRGLVLDEMGARQRWISASRDPAVAGLRRDVLGRKERMAELLVRGAGTRSFKRYAATIELTRQSVAEAERNLYAASVEDRAAASRSDAGLEEVLNALPPGCGVVAFARYRHFEKKIREDRYLAFYRNAVGDRGVVRLGRAERIDAAVVKWREEASQGALARGRAPAQAESAATAAGNDLRSLVWDPVEAKCGGAHRVFVVPDGMLDLVNLGALPAARGGYLCEADPVLHYLTTERDLIVSPVAVAPDGSALLVGGPDYDRREEADAGSAEAARVAERTAPRWTAAACREFAIAASGPYSGLRAACGDFDRVRFTPLPGTEREVRRIAELMRSSDGSSAGPRSNRPLVLCGMNADESRVKALAGEASVLHVATHGFFLAGSCPSATTRARAIGAIAFEDEEPGALGAPAPPGPSAGEHPLRLSGLALAGANLRDAARPGTDDGILTAEEITALDLSSVQWAVLSACDTGVGDVRAGEGVFGLRRAFQIAGAKTIIMSLWSVDDQSTQEWMERLYAARLQRGVDTAQAAHDATVGLLRDRRARGESTHPFYWAAFLAAGDWR